jgi:hypothetical protein
MLRRPCIRLIKIFPPSPKPKWFGAFLLCQSRQKNFTAGTTTVPEISNLLAAQKIRFSKTFDFIEFSRRVRRWHCQS